MSLRALTTGLFLLLASAATAEAVTIVNRDGESRRVLVCESDTCGPQFGDDWGSAFDFWLAPGESHSFACRKCFVGVYDRNGVSPTLGDMVDAEMDGDLFSGEQRGSIVNGWVRRDP
jgi:hypothetical protein